MTQTAVAAQIHQTLDVHRIFAAQVAFNLVVAVDGFADLQNFCVGQLIDAAIKRDTDLLDDFGSKLVADTVDVGQRDHNALVCGNVYASYAGHLLLHVGRSCRRVIIDPRPVEAGPCGVFTGKTEASLDGQARNLPSHNPTH